MAAHSQLIIVCKLPCCKCSAVRIYGQKLNLLDPFRKDVSAICDDEPFIADEQIDLQNSSGKKALFMDIPAGKFWCCCRVQFSKLAKMAFEVIVPFVTTYRCEQSFSVMTVVKKNQRNRSEAMFVPALSKTEPRIMKLAASHIKYKKLKTQYLECGIESQKERKTVKINVGMSNLKKTGRKCRICMFA